MPDDVTGQNCEEAIRNGFKYTVYTENATWEEAQDACEAGGLVLTSIFDTQAHELLLTYAKYLHNYLFSLESFFPIRAFYCIISILV